MTEKYEGYIIDTGNRQHFGDGKGCLTFKRGVAVLDLEAYAEKRFDWVETINTDTFKQVAGLPLKNYADYWDDLGAKVSKCSKSEAKEVRKAINTGKSVVPEKFLSVPWEEVAVKEEEPTKEPDDNEEPDGPEEPLDGKTKAQMEKELEKE